MKICKVLLLMAIFAGCTRSSDIIPENKMTRVMWDMIQADEFVTGYLTKDSTLNIKLERMKLYQKVFALHRVSEKEYFESFKYYAGKPAMFKILVDSISEKASREQRNLRIPSKSVLK